MRKIKEIRLNLAEAVSNGAITDCFSFGIQDGKCCCGRTVDEVILRQPKQKSLGFVTLKDTGVEI